MGTQLPLRPKKGTQPPIFSPCLLWPNGGCIRIPNGMEVDLGPDNIVLDGNPAPTSPKGVQPQFSAHVCCGQTAGWTKMPLGTEVGLGPGDFVLDGDPARPRGTATPLFSAHVYCGHGRPSQLLPSSCNDFPGNQLPKRYTIWHLKMHRSILMIHNLCITR